MNRWVLGLLLGFAAVVAANGVLVYLAVEHAPEVVPSYDASRR